MIHIFGVPFGRPRVPTPLEVATKRYIETQLALLSAADEQERAKASVQMFIERLERLRLTMAELSKEQLHPVELGHLSYMQHGKIDKFDPQPTRE